MNDHANLNLSPMVYNWGSIVNGKWEKKGKIIITSKGILKDNERLSSPRYQKEIRRLIFGGAHGSFARTGSLTFDTSQLYFHGLMEQDNGESIAVTGFAANFDVKFKTLITPSGETDSPSEGPTLQISINETAFDGPFKNSPIKYSLTIDGNCEDITDRVLSFNLNRKNQSYELKMDGGGPFSDSDDLFDIIMQLDNSSFEGSYEDNSNKFNWKGKKEKGSLSSIEDAIEEAILKLEKATIPKIKCTAYDSNDIIMSKNTAVGDIPILPGLTKDDQAFITQMDKQGIKIATLDNLVGVKMGKDKDGKNKIMDQAQTIANSSMNTASLTSLDKKYKKDFGIKPDEFTGNAALVMQNNSEFFQNNANLQMGNVLKSKQDDGNFKEKDVEAIKRINKKKLAKNWVGKTMTTERLNGYIKASSEMYADAYIYVNSEFEAIVKGDKEQWARVYYHWLTDPNKLHTLQNELSSLDPDAVAIKIYEWHAKLSALAPHKSYAASMQVYAMSLYINAQSQQADWIAKGIPILTQAISSGGETNTDVCSADGQIQANPNAEIIQEKLASLSANVGAEIVANSISSAALKWQKANGSSSKTYLKYYKYLYKDPAALDEISSEMDSSKVAAFKAWIMDVNSNSGITANNILGYCVFAAINGVLLAGFAPKDSSNLKTEALTDDDIKWVLKGVKIGQVVICSSAVFYTSFFAWRISSIWIRYIGTISTEMPEISGAVKAIAGAIEEGADIAGWGLAFGANLSNILKVAGPILSLVGIGLSAYSLYQDIMGDRPVDGILDSLSILTAAIGVGIATAVAFGLVTAASTGPVGLAIAAIGLIILAFKLLWDFLFPKPDPIQSFVDGPLTDLGVIGT